MPLEHRLERRPQAGSGRHLRVEDHRGDLGACPFPSVFYHGEATHPVLPYHQIVNLRLFQGDGAHDHQAGVPVDDHLVPGRHLDAHLLGDGLDHEADHRGGVRHRHGERHLRGAVDVGHAAVPVRHARHGRPVPARHGHARYQEQSWSRKRGIVRDQP